MKKTVIFLLGLCLTLTLFTATPARADHWSFGFYWPGLVFGVGVGAPPVAYGGCGYYGGWYGGPVYRYYGGYHRGYYGGHQGRYYYGHHKYGYNGGHAGRYHGGYHGGYRGGYYGGNHGGGHGR